MSASAPPPAGVPGAKVRMARLSTTVGSLDERRSHEGAASSHESSSSRSNATNTKLPSSSSSAIGAAPPLPTVARARTAGGLGSQQPMRKLSLKAANATTPALMRRPSSSLGGSGAGDSSSSNSNVNCTANSSALSRLPSFGGALTNGVPAPGSTTTSNLTHSTTSTSLARSESTVRKPLGSLSWQARMRTLLQVRADLINAGRSCAFLDSRIETLCAETGMDTDEAVRIAQLEEASASPFPSVSTLTATAAHNSNGQVQRAAVVKGVKSMGGGNGVAAVPFEDDEKGDRRNGSSRTRQAGGGGADESLAGETRGMSSSLGKTGDSVDDVVRRRLDSVRKIIESGLVASASEDADPHLDAHAIEQQQQQQHQDQLSAAPYKKPSLATPTTTTTMNALEARFTTSAERRTTAPTSTLAAAPAQPSQSAASGASGDSGGLMRLSARSSVGNIGGVLRLGSFDSVDTEEQGEHQDRRLQRRKERLEKLTGSARCDSMSAMPSSSRAIMAARTGRTTAQL